MRRLILAPAAERSGPPVEAARSGAGVTAQQEHEPRPGRGFDRVAVRYIGMGVELAAAVVGLTLLGLWIDHGFGTKPVGTVVGACLGVVGGLYNFIRSAWRLRRESPPAGRRARTSGNDGHRPES